MQIHPNLLSQGGEGEKMQIHPNLLPQGGKEKNCRFIPAFSPKGEKEQHCSDFEVFTRSRDSFPDLTRSAALDGTRSRTLRS